MKLFFKIFVFFSALFSFVWAETSQDQSLYWIVQEDFIKFGKKDMYETQQKGWLDGFCHSGQGSGFWRRTNGFIQTIGLQGLDEPQYIYLIPLQGTNGISDFFAKRDQYNQSLSEEGLKNRKMLLSSLNFSISSLHQYLTELCFMPSNGDFSWASAPFLHYWVFGISPGFEEDFQNYLKTLLSKHVSSSSVASRVWKVLLGADTPKYVVVLSASSQEALDKVVTSIPFIEGPVKDIVRNERQGRAQFRPQLSVLNP